MHTITTLNDVNTSNGIIDASNGIAKAIIERAKAIKAIKAIKESSNRKKTYMPFKKIKDQPDQPFSLSWFIDETDYNYGKSSEAAYLIGVPNNTLSPYELKHILDNANQLTILSISTQIELPDDNTDQSIDKINKAYINVICLVADNLVDPDSSRLRQEKQSRSHVQLPNVIPVAILRNKDYEELNELTGPALDIAKNVVSTYANMLTMQGYEVQWATNTPVVTTGIAIDTAANQGKSLLIKVHRRTFQSINNTPFQPGKLFTDDEDKKDHIIVFPHREISSDGVVEPIARYEEAIAFFCMASEAPELFHDDTKLQRLFHARIVQAAACVAQGCISLAHFADYVLKMNYEEFDIKNYDLHRACNPAELLLKSDPLKDPLYNPFHLDIIIPKNDIHDHIHQYQKDAVESINKNGMMFSDKFKKQAKNKLNNLRKTAKDYNKTKATNEALQALGVDFTTTKEEAQRDAILAYKSAIDSYQSAIDSYKSDGEPGYFRNPIKRETMDEWGRIKTDREALSSLKNEIEARNKKSKTHILTPNGYVPKKI